MDRRNLQQSMYEVSGNTTVQRFTLAIMVGLWVALAWWLLLGGGLDTAHRWFGWIGTSGDTGRQVSLAVAFSIYYLRMLFTVFVFLKRGVSWSEVFTISPWALFIFLLLGIAGGTNPATMGVAGAFGAILFLVGSWMNSWAEYSRHAWKSRDENRGKLYTAGLFRYCRHPNYLGDLLSFSGLCLITGRWATAVIPASMLAGFVFVNVPVLDSHLHDHYGKAFDDYASRTSRLIPFIY